MLVLSRRVGEIVMINDGALMILENEDGQIRIGFEFPKDVRIVRGDIATLNAAASKCLTIYRTKQMGKGRRHDGKHSNE